MILSRRQIVVGGLALASLLSNAAARSRTSSAWLSTWLAAFNDRRANAYPEFVKAHMPSLLPYLDEDLAVREASGGFALLRAETAPGAITAWVRDRHWDRFSKVLLAIGDGRIDDLSFAGAPAPAGFVVARTSETNALNTLGHKLRDEAKADRFSGSVLVARHGDLLFREAYGARDGDASRVATPATRYCIGSMGKMFTAVAVLQQVAAGRLRLTDTIAMLLPDYPDTPLARSVTVGQLLTHTGGTGDFFGPEYEAHAGELRTPSDFIRLFGQRDALFAPGSRWSYSNFGFILLGAMLEQLSGDPWQACLQRNIFRVAGMSATSANGSPDDTAVPLTGSAATGLKPLPYYVGLPAGGGYSTIEDLHRFALALRQGALLDPAHLRLLTTPKVPAGDAQWSFGLRVALRNGEPCYGHRGSAPGVSADFAIYPRSGYLVVILSNRGHPHALNPAEFVGARLPTA